MQYFEPVIIVVSFGLASSLLWLGAELAALAATRPLPVSVALTSVAALLAACGLWWPGHLLPADPARGTASLLNALPALLLAVCAGVTGALASGRRKFLVIVGVVFMLMAAYGHAMLAAPGLFRLARTAGGLGAGAALVTLCAALVAAQLRYGNARSGPVLRVAAVLVAAAVICLGAFVSAAPLSAATLVWTELLMLGGLIAVASVLRLVLGQGSTTEPEAPARAARTAAVDNLTGLPTRLYFESKLTDAARKCRDGGARLAVFFIDLDGFKPVNDSFGHSSGDRVLEQVGQRLKALARGAGVAARVGGDEFVLMAPAAGAQSAAAQLASRVIEVLSKPYRVDEREVTISCSVGIALYPEGCSSNKLIARADAAMYAAKRAGGSRHCFYSREMDADVQQNFDMLRDLREALVRNELELFFQPKVDARSGKVTAAEALIRWNHPSRGLVMPGEFIPLAERSGLIGPLGDWVIEAACKQARAWRDKGLRMRVAINLSAYQMRQDDIADRITEALARYLLSSGPVECQSLVIATGGKSIPKMGATLFGYRVAEQFGLAVTETRPALVPLTFEPHMLDRLKALAGVAVDAVVSHGAVKFAEALLFTHRGLSGPSILQISSYWREGGEIGVNLSPGRDVYPVLREARQTNGRQEPQTVLSQVLPRGAAQFVTEQAGVSGRLADLSDKKLQAVADALHHWRIKPSGSEGYRTAEVTLGGVSTEELDQRTMQSKRVPGLFFIGEVVDVTGWLGGYNFQWAWSSGFASGQDA